MQPKLKEEPKEWAKFTAVTLAVAGLATFLACRRHSISPRAGAAVAGVLGLVLFVCLIRPRWFRSYYRAGMTISFHLGQVVGRVMLTVFFLVVLTPLGLGLRVLGKDLLRLKRRPTGSYWQPARTSNQFDRQF